MPLGDGPKNIPPIEYIINIGIALVGGLVSFIRMWRETLAKPEAVMTLKQLALLACERVLCAGFAGVLMLWFLKSYGINDYYIAFAVAVAGHMGPEAMELFKGAVSGRLGKLSSDQGGTQEKR